MRKPIYRMLILTAVLAFVLSGCDSIIRETEPVEEEKEIQATVVPEQTEVPATATPIPVPTATPSPRRMGIRAEGARSFYLINNIGDAIRGLYIRNENYNEWGDNLITAESSFRAGEQIELFYMPAGNGNPNYEIRIVTKNNSDFYMYQVPMDDISSDAVASFMINNKNNLMSLRYTSIASGEICDAGNTWFKLEDPYTDQEMTVYDEEYQEYQTTDQNQDSGNNETYSEEGSYNEDYNEYYDYTENNYGYDESYDSEYEVTYD